MKEKYKEKRTIFMKKVKESQQQKKKKKNIQKDLEEKVEGKLRKI